MSSIAFVSSWIVDTPEMGGQAAFRSRLETPPQPTTTQERIVSDVVKSKMSENDT